MLLRWRHATYYVRFFSYTIYCVERAKIDLAINLPIAKISIVTDIGLIVYL